MGEILWGLLSVLERTSKVAYWIAMAVLSAIILAGLGWAYFSGHLVQ